MSNSVQAELVRFFTQGGWVPLAVAVGVFATLLRQGTVGLAPVPVRRRPSRRR